MAFESQQHKDCPEEKCHPAPKMFGEDEADANTFYGKNASGVSGFHPLPEGLGGGVTSVNGQTGNVELTAVDVGADAAGAAEAVRDNLDDHTGGSSVHSVASIAGLSDALSLKRNITIAPASILTDGLVRRYILNGDADDSSGGGYHATWNSTWNGQPQYLWDPTLGRYVAVLDAVAYLTAPDTGLPAGSDACTICGWMSTMTNGSAYLASYGTSDKYTSTQLRGLLQSATGNIMAANGTTFPEGKVAMYAGLGWRHMAAVFNGGSVFLYINGWLSWSATLTQTTTLSGSLYLGTRPGISGLADSLMADVRIYNRVLSAAELLSITKWEA